MEVGGIIGRKRWRSEGYGEGLVDWMERGPGVHSLGGASAVSAEGFSLLYPHLKWVSEKGSANWLGVGRRTREQ